jgi:hypothetical protein
MRTLIIFIILFAVVCFANDASERYPNPKLTPGKVTDVSKDVLCKSGYTATVRFVSEATKKEVFKRYGIDLAKRSNYEVDHFISLELGGLNDIENLWPQIYCPVGNKPDVSGCYGAREKDRVETNLNRRICAGTITMQQAQDIIKTDWIAEYNKIVGK